MIEISPAILTNDVSDFRKKYAELFALSHEFTKLHVDFADGLFVNTVTVMPAEVDFIKSSPFTLMAHVMALHPEKYFKEIKKIGFKYVIFHFESITDRFQVADVIAFAKYLELKVGLAVNPETPLYRIAKHLSNVDLVQIMGIQPGRQGREFMPSTLDKVKELRSLSKSAIIIVDGGVKVGIAHKLAEAGADILVAGSAIVQAKDPKKAIEDLKADIQI
jgi:ribulose-phosphate 3-epimerase